MYKGITQYKHPLSLVFLLFFLTSCGFRPIYRAENSTTHEFLGNIEISPISSVNGANFYNHLENILPHGNRIKYLLTSNITFLKDISIIQKNSDILREIITVKVTYTLTDKKTGKTITSGKFSRLASFNTTFSPYSNLVKQQDIQKNLAVMSAEEVRNRIMLYIENNKNSDITK